MRILETKKEQKIEPEKVDESKKSIDRTICTISETIKNLLIRQLKHEMDNYFIYRQFAFKFKQKGLNKLYEYWEGRAKEELEHHQWILNYLTQCDASFDYTTNPVEKLDMEDLIDPFKFTVNREIETTMMIYEIVDKANEEKDWATISFLMGDDKEFGKLVIEQREEEKLSRDILDIVKNGEDWLAIQDSIYEFYFK